MKKKMTILGLLLAGVVVTGYSVSGTYAKYVSANQNITDSANIAAWKITLNDATDDLSKGTTSSFDLFKDGENTKVLKPGDSEKKLVTIYNKGDVDAILEYFKIDFDSTTTKPNELKSAIKFAITLDGDEDSITSYEELDNLDLSSLINTVISKKTDSGDGSLKFYIHYKWENNTTTLAADGSNIAAYIAANKDDTTIGTTDGAKLVLKSTIVVSQKVD